MREVRHLGNVAGNRVCRVPALSQVMLESDGMRPDGTGSKPINFDDARAMRGVYGDLQKWDHQYAPTPKLCPVQRMNIPPYAALMQPLRRQR